MSRLNGRYENAKILAPMVRIGTMPTRLLALQCGADLVYTEEIIDFKMLQCKRQVNELLGTTDYVWNDGTVVFRTCDKEKDKVVFQMGTSDGERALKVAKMIEQDVSAIDINMGCPKAYSVSGGMGAALLGKPEKIKEILETLVQNVKLPVTCKIRILPKMEDTLALVKMIQSTGVAAIGIHGRYRDERPRHANHNNIIKILAESLQIPVIANGGSKDHIKRYEDISVFQESCGAAAVMVARAAQWNPSIFRPEGMLERDAIIKEYLKYAINYDNVMTNIKYCVQQLMHEFLDTPTGQALQAANTTKQICDLWEMGSYYDQTVDERRKRAIDLQKKAGGRWKKRKLHDGTEIIEASFMYNKRLYPGNRSPKMILNDWTIVNNKDRPIYDTKQNPKDMMFHSILTVDGVKYSSTLWDKAKRPSEQTAASICLQVMGIHDGRSLPPDPSDEHCQPLVDEDQLIHCPRKRDLDKDGNRNGQNDALIISKESAKEVDNSKDSNNTFKHCQNDSKRTEIREDNVEIEENVSMNT